MSADIYENIKDKIDKKAGMVNRGNWGRIKSVMNRAAKGEPVNIAFLGGSITQGCNATTHEGCYAYLTYEWFKSKYPDSDVTYINAGIGGTTSQFGVSRVDKDVFSKKPDMVFVEFSVNDENTDFFKETYEGLVRHIYYHESKPAVMLIHNIQYDNGFTSFEKHIEIGKYYNLPSVSIITTVYDAMKKGVMASLDITTDNLHPNDAGHKLLRDVITYYLNEIDKDRVNEEDSFEEVLKPLTENEYEKSVRYQCMDITAVKDGFTDDTREKEYFTDNFKGGWITKKQGASITFNVKGSGVAVQYRQTPNKPAPVAKAVIDGDEEKAVILDGNFTQDWGDNLAISNILVHGENKDHELKITITEAHDDDKSDFYLLSVIASE